MAGLPKSYIKKYGISKRAWSEYRKAKRGGGTKRRATKRSPAKRSPARRTTTAVAKRAAPARRRGRGRAVARNVMDKTTQNTLKIGSGVAGAVGSAVLIKMLPFGKIGQSITQLGGGLLMMAMIPKRQRIVRFASYGMSLAGGLALLKNTFPAVPLLAGNNNRRIMNRSNGRAQIVEPTGAIRTDYEPMGKNKDFAMGENRNFASMGYVSGRGGYNPYK